MEFFSREIEEADPAVLEMVAVLGSQIGLFIERVRAEAQLRQTTDDLARSNTDLQQFAYVASHDLFEPLRMVTSYVQLLRDRYKARLDRQAEEFIAFALDGAKRMEALIHDLLAYARVDTRGRSLEPTEAERVFQEAVANLKVAIEESGAAIEHGPLPRVRADRVQLSQVFQNLLGNAIKFRGTEVPRIEVLACRRDNEWLFSVRDNGIGIDPKQFERVFIIFQRLHTRQEYAGTGMGLAICKKIIERHGGRIWVESVPGKGATFFFTLPVMDGT
jgi:light-regulated signal transduction histidine kinase (bacteriophytochrome)